MNSTSGIRKILYINTAFLGDAILSTPVIKALKDIYPQAEIDVIAIAQTKTVFKGNPHVRSVIVLHKKGFWQRWASLLGIIRDIRRQSYDLAISPHVHGSTSLLMVLGGIPLRIGFPRLKGANVKANISKGMPVVKRNLCLLQHLSRQVFSHQTQMYWSEQESRAVDEFISRHQLEPQRLVVIAPGSVWATKRWPGEYYTDLISALSADGWQCVLIGGKEDRELCDAVIPTGAKAVYNSAGDFSINASAYLLSRAKLLIGNDSAPLHLANAVQTPVLAVFGPTVERFGFYPFGERDRVVEIDMPCRPCGKHGHNVCPQGHFKCMKGVLPQEVLKHANEMLQ